MRDIIDMYGDSLPQTITDNNGSITNVLFGHNFKHVAVIRSKAGSTRSNHWHRNGFHYLYVVSGSMIYSERDLDGGNRKIRVIGAGQMVFTPSNKVHKTEFPEDTVLISLTNNLSQEEHEADLVREQY